MLSKFNSTTIYIRIYIVEGVLIKVLRSFRDFKFCSVLLFGVQSKITCRLQVINYIYDYCWRALARQLPILYNSEKKAKSVGCKIGDMRS